MTLHSLLHIIQATSLHVLPLQATHHNSDHQDIWLNLIPTPQLVSHTAKSRPLVFPSLREAGHGDWVFGWYEGDCECDVSLRLGGRCQNLLDSSEFSPVSPEDIWEIISPFQPYDGISRLQHDCHYPVLYSNGSVFSISPLVKDLGLFIVLPLDCYAQVTRVSRRIAGNRSTLCRLQNFMPPKIEITIMQSLKIPIIDCGGV